MPDDDRNIWDTLGGLVGSVLKPVIGEKRIPILKQAIGAGLIGGGTHGDPNAIASYWGTIDQIQQRKQLQELWHNLHPDQPMPPGIQSPQDMLPQYSQPGKYGVWEYPPGGGPPHQLPGTAPQEPPKVHGPQALLAEEEAVFKAQTGRMPQTPDEYQSVYDIAQTNIAQRKQAETQALRPPEKPQKPTIHVFPDGTQRIFKPDGSYVDLPAPAGFSPKTKAIKVLQNAGGVYGAVDETGKTWAASDPKMPENLRTLVQDARQVFRTKQNMLTAATKTMVDSAPSVLSFVDQLEPLIDQNVSEMGPAVGRWNDFMTGRVGATNPSFAKLRSTLDLLSSALARMHVGARGGVAMTDRFDRIIGRMYQSPDNMRASLDVVRQYANDLLALRAQREQGLPVEIPVAPGKIRVRRKSDGQTGQIPESEFDATVYDRMQ